MRCSICDSTSTEDTTEGSSIYYWVETDLETRCSRCQDEVKATLGAYELSDKYLVANPVYDEKEKDNE